MYNTSLFQYIELLVNSKFITQEITMSNHTDTPIYIHTQANKQTQTHHVSLPRWVFMETMACWKCNKPILAKSKKISLKIVFFSMSGYIVHVQASFPILCK